MRRLCFVFRDAAACRAQLGDVAPVQVQRAELELLRVQNELTNAQAERLVRRAVLNQLIGQAPETPLRVALPLPAGSLDALRVRPGFARAGAAGVVPSLSAAVTPNVVMGGGSQNSPGNASAIASSEQASSDMAVLRGRILPNALVNRPDIAGAQAMLESRHAQAQVLRRERLPNIELQARRSSFTGSGATALRAVITVPVFGGSNKRERRALEVEARAQEAQEAQIALLRSQVAAQVEQGLIRLQQQRQTVERFLTGIVPLTHRAAHASCRSRIVPLTLELLRKTQIGYAAGASTYLEVLEAQCTLRQVQTEYLQALVGTRTQEAALESALGATLPTDLSSNRSNPTDASTPPGVAAPGTVPEGAASPNVVVPINPANAEAGK